MYITYEGLQRYKEELFNLQNILPTLIKETGEMAALGDRSENAGYINAKAQMRRTQNRIRYLEDLIKHSKLIQNTSTEIINMGSTVKLLNKVNNNEEIYTIVDSIEADPTNNFISFHSPLGKLLLGKRKNESIILETSHFKTVYKILSIQ